MLNSSSTLAVKRCKTMEIAMPHDLPLSVLPYKKEAKTFRVLPDIKAAFSDAQNKVASFANEPIKLTETHSLSFKRKVDCAKVISPTFLSKYGYSEIPSRRDFYQRSKQ